MRFRAVSVGVRQRRGLRDRGYSTGLRESSKRSLLYVQGQENKMNHIKKIVIRIAITVSIVSLMCWAAWAQRAPQTKDGASIVVDGIVREIFRSPRQTQVDYVVQVEVSRSEYGRSTDRSQEGAGTCTRRPDLHPCLPALGRQPAKAWGQRPHAIPAERSEIKAYLYPSAQGGWEGAFPDWFDQTGIVAQNRTPNMNPSLLPSLLQLRYLPRRPPRSGRRRGLGRSCIGWESGPNRSTSAVGWS